MPNVTTHRMCRGEIFFARPCATHPQSPGYQQSPRHESWCPSNLTMHHGCTGEKYFAPTCANVIHSPNHQTWPRHESWCAPDSPPHHGCRGKTFFARPCAFDAPSTTRCDRAPAMRRRTMDVRAKYISPVRAPTISIRPTIKHRRPINRGAHPM